MNFKTVFSKLLLISAAASLTHSATVKANYTAGSVTQQANLDGLLTNFKVNKSNETIDFTLNWDTNPTLTFDLKTKKISMADGSTMTPTLQSVLKRNNIQKILVQNYQFILQDPYANGLPIGCLATADLGEKVTITDKTPFKQLSPSYRAYFTEMVPYSNTSSSIFITAAYPGSEKRNANLPQLLLTKIQVSTPGAISFVNPPPTFPGGAEYIYFRYIPFTPDAPWQAVFEGNLYYEHDHGDCSIAVVSNGDSIKHPAGYVPPYFNLNLVPQALVAGNYLKAEESKPATSYVFSNIIVHFAKNTPYVAPSNNSDDDDESPTTQRPAGNFLYNAPVERVTFDLTAFRPGSTPLLATLKSLVYNRADNTLTEEASGKEPTHWSTTNDPHSQPDVTEIIDTFWGSIYGEIVGPEKSSSEQPAETENATTQQPVYPTTYALYPEFNTDRSSAKKLVLPRFCTYDPGIELHSYLVTDFLFTGVATLEEKDSVILTDAKGKKLRSYTIDSISKDKDGRVTKIAYIVNALGEEVFNGIKENLENLKAEYNVRSGVITSKKAICWGSVPVVAQGVTDYTVAVPSPNLDAYILNYFFVTPGDESAK